MRQRGKVAELALGFCGGVNALLAMAAGYGLHLSAEEARSTVDAWRLANPWVRDFSQELWLAALTARKLPGVTAARRPRRLHVPPRLPRRLAALHAAVAPRADLPRHAPDLDGRARR